MRLNNMRENEIKFTLIKEEYEQLKKELLDSGAKSRLQINYYYDTEELDLLRNDITVRVRQKEDELRLQIKYPLCVENHIVSKKEIECTIDKIEKEFVLDKTVWEDSDWDIEKHKIVKYYGELITFRTSLQYNEWLKLELDYNCYLGISDYELEVEIESGKEEEALKLLEGLFGDRYKHTEYGKCKRFYKQYGVFYSK